MKRKDKREMIKLCGDGKKKFICPSLSKATRLYCSKSTTSLESYFPLFSVKRKEGMILPPEQMMLNYLLVLELQSVTYNISQNTMTIEKGKENLLHRVKANRKKRDTNMALTVDHQKEISSAGDTLDWLPYD